MLSGEAVMKRATRSGCCAFFFVAAACLGAHAAAADLLWRIGDADGSAGEFALSATGYKPFPREGYYVIGRSDPGIDWPFVHPGPWDRWAERREHPFTVVFGLDAVSDSGDCVLTLGVLGAEQQAPKLKASINGEALESFQLRGGAAESLLEGDTAGAKVQRVDLVFPPKLLRQGENTIVLSSENGKWFVYDWLGFAAPPGTRLASDPPPATRIGTPRTPPLLYEVAGAMRQSLQIPVHHFAEEIDAELMVTGNAPERVQLVRGTQIVEARPAAVSEETPVTLEIRHAGRVLASATVPLRPVRHWEIHMLHHTHLDIGYTHLQSDVEKLQWQHLEQAIGLARETADYPPEARFKWIPEGLWAIDGYLRQATVEQQEAFFDAVRAGSVGLDALYGNELTALCRPEELLELTGYARRLAREHGLTIDSAMITDVPGYTWGLIPALAQSGVRYLSIGPNSGHRVGFTRTAWSDTPFYWISPSGKERVLCWMAGKGYSWFHTGLNYTEIEHTANERPILDYLDELTDSGFPYDLVQIRYNIGSDNGPPDPGLPDFVKAWNEKFTYPKMIIATASQSFHAFEKRYADEIPEVRGDFTPYWEDGAGSSARETALNRAAAERLVQAQALFAMTDPARYAAAAFNEAWRNVILYDEHTWGAWNSISDPQNVFVLDQWEQKQRFALDADRQSQALLDGAMDSVALNTEEVSSVLVFNTNSWARTDLVVLPAGWKLPGDAVREGQGASVPSQRLSTGELAFLAREVPAFAARRFEIHSGAPESWGSASAQGSQLSDGKLTLLVDDDSGAIASLRQVGVPMDLVNRESGLGLNDYLYVAGRDPANPQRVLGVTITVKEQGPLVASLLIESAAPGCASLTRELRLVSGLPQVEIIDTLDKEAVYQKEGVHIAFPFNVPGGVVRMETPWAVVRPELDQMNGACKNYFTVQRWVDVANDQFGVALATIDAPLIELNRITADPVAVGWIEHFEPTQTVYSYVMNNYWETNYKAAQDGPTIFRYALLPHGPYNAADLHRFGTERSQPLLAAPCGAEYPSHLARTQIAVENAAVTALKPSHDGKALILRLYNPLGEATTAALPPVPHFELSNLFEDPGQAIGASLDLAPYEFVTLRTAL